MKSSELNNLILRNGWKVVRQSGSHIIYEKMVFIILRLFTEARKLEEVWK